MYPLPRGIDTWGQHGTVRMRFEAPSGFNLAAHTCKSKHSAAEGHRNRRIGFFQRLLNQTRPKGIQVTPKSLPRCFRRSRASSSKLQCAPQNSPETPAVCPFPCVLGDLHLLCLKAVGDVQFRPKMTLRKHRTQMIFVSEDYTTCFEWQRWLLTFW